MNFGNYGNNFQNNAMNMSNNLTPQNQININQNNMNMTDSSNFVPPLYQMNQMNLMNQNTMNMNPNSLYMMNFQQTYQNIQPSVELLDINFNNMCESKFFIYDELPTNMAKYATISETIRY